MSTESMLREPSHPSTPAPFGAPSAATHEWSGGRVSTVLGSKLRGLDNVVRQIRSHLWIHVAAGLVTLIMVLLGGGLFFQMLFGFLLRPEQEPFGAPLLERLVGIVLLAFFSMLVFSNLIITLTTTYISKETEFLMGFPLRFRSLFGIKLVESVVYSSWAFALLSLPLFAAYGRSKGAPFGYYPAALLLGIPFLVVPAALGALITMLLSAFLPAKRARSFTVGLFLAAILILVIIARLMGLRSMLTTTTLQDFSQIMALLQVGSIPLLPSAWLAEGIKAASEGQWRTVGYWFLCLLSTAMMSVQICLWLVPSLYYRGWALAKEGGGGGGSEGAESRPRWSPFRLSDRAFSVFSRPIQALLGKDLRTFWRDPTQWSQLVLLFGPLLFYILNIRGITSGNQNLRALFKHWPTVVSFFNIGAASFVLSILTTRFIYPLLSLEGKQYWVVGLAPFPKQKLVWQKWCLCAVVCVGSGLLLIISSNIMLQVQTSIAALGIVTVVFLGLGLTSLAVGLGAIFPDFKQDNPARIANGLGGTLNIMASLGYITATLAIELPLATRMVSMIEGLEPTGARGMQLWGPVLSVIWPHILLLLALHIAVIIIPMRMGIRRWMNLEFHL